MTTLVIRGTEYRLPFAELFRALSETERAELAASIRALGVMSPVFVYNSPTWGPNCVIDGANRLREGAAAEIDVPVQRFAVSDETARRMAEDLNIARRQVTPEEARAARVKRVVAARVDQKQSLRAIAAREQVSEKQVRNDLDKATAEGGTQLNPTDRVTGLDGKSRPATRPAQVESPPQDEEEKDQREDREEPAHHKPHVKKKKETRAPAHLDPKHPYRELLSELVAWVTKASKAVNDSPDGSPLRNYLIYTKLVYPRAKIVNNRNFGWQFIAARGYYRVFSLAGRTGTKQLTRAQVLKEYEAAIDPKRPQEGGAPA